jgi:hypothetical protein
VDKISIWNAEGAEIGSYELIPGAQKLDIDLNGFSDGIYLVGLERDGKLLTKKMIIQSY